jgi:hypothetical protein
VSERTLIRESSRAVVVHRVRARQPWVIATFITLLLPTVVAGAAIGFQPWLAILLASLSWFSAIWLLLVMSLWRRATRIDANKTPQTAIASQEGLFVDGGPALVRDAIVAAFVSPSYPNGAYVRVHRRGGFPVELWTADVDGAHALVSKLGLDATRVASIATGAPILSRLVPRILAGVLVCAVALLIAQLAPVLTALIPVLAVAYAALGLSSQEFVVGTDGVVVRWLGRRLSFTPIAAVASVEQLPGLVRLQLHDGGNRDLVVARRLGDAAGGIGMQVGLLAERIRGAMRRSGTMEVDASALERGDRDIASWLAALRDLSRGTGYRAAVQREDLVFLAEDAQTKPLLRIAAAVALGATDDHERARLRIAAESSSLPEVSEALDAVLGGEEEKLVNALKRVDG